MQFRIHLWVDDANKAFDIEAEQRPLVVTYKSRTYVHGPWDKFYPANVVHLRMSDLVIKEPRKTKATANLVDRQTLENARSYAQDQRYGFKYRNRSGKEYVTITNTADNNYRFDLKEYFPEAICTSGGMYEKTYRINP